MAARVVCVFLYFRESKLVVAYTGSLQKYCLDFQQEGLFDYLSDVTFLRGNL